MKIVFARREMKIVFALFILLLMPSLVWAQQIPTQCVTTVAAGGTGDAIQLPQLPCWPTTTLAIIKLTATNLTTTPTISVNGGSPVTIVNYDGSPIADGLFAANQTRLFNYDGANWRLLTVDTATFINTPGVFSVTAFGAVCDGVADDHVAINLAIAAAQAAGGGKVLFPEKRCYSSTAILVPPNVFVNGVAFFPGNPPTGSGIECSVLPCVILSGDLTNNGVGNGTAAMLNMVIGYTSTTPPNSPAIEILGGYDINLYNVMAYQAYDGFAFVGTCTSPPSTGCQFGIHMNGHNLFTGAIGHCHFLFNNWPEAYIEGGRAGMNGGDLNSSGGYACVTGGQGGGGQGPNTIQFSDFQFNGGRPLCWWNFYNIHGAGVNVAEF